MSQVGLDAILVAAVNAYRGSDGNEILRAMAAGINGSADEDTTADTEDTGAGDGQGKD